VTFPTDDIFLGPASFGLRKGHEGIIWHTTEGAGPSRSAAVATATWQKSNPGSYNWIIYDGGLLLTVPYLEASGGVNPLSSSWAPGRFPWLKSALSAAAYADPNAYLLNVAFSGKTAVFRDQGLPPNMLATAKQLVEWVEAQPWCSRMVASGHLHWQTNRTDPSLQVLAAITSEAPDDMQFWKPVQEDWWTVPGVTFYDGNGTEKSFTTRERVTSVAEATDGHRLVKYGTNELLVMPRTGLVPISGTRVPAAPNYGFPPPTGFTQAQLDAAKAQGVTAGKADMKAKAIVAAENHTTTVRGLK
jgi:hypothetical protein